jgi:uncharacterized membrane protein
VNFSAALVVEVIRGKEVTKAATVESRRALWINVLSRHFPALKEVAVQLLSLHATSCAAERDWSKWGKLYHKYRNALTVGKAAQMIFVAENAACQKSNRQEVSTQHVTRARANMTEEQCKTVDDAWCVSDDL